MYTHRLHGLGRRFAVAAILCLLLPLGLFLNGCGGRVELSRFDWTVDPLSQTVPAGGRAVFEMTLLEKVDINSNVRFRVEGLPPGATTRWK